VGDIDLAVVQDSSVTVDFDFVDWTFTVAEAAAQGNSQSIPTMYFGKRSAKVRMRVGLNPLDYFVALHLVVRDQEVSHSVHVLPQKYDYRDLERGEAQLMRVGHALWRDRRELSDTVSEREGIDASAIVGAV
jgi:hypothetical protein